MDVRRVRLGVCGPGFGEVKPVLHLQVRQAPTTAEDPGLPGRVALHRGRMGILLSNQPCQVLRPRQPQYVIFTDASDDGWGAVIFDKNGNGDTIMGDHWSPIDASRHISLRELMVVRLAFSRWIQRGVSVVVFMDNTTAIGQLRRGRSNAFLANSELRRLKMVIESKHLTITGFQYVRSAENHADYWSREGLRILQLASTEGHGLLEGHRSVPFEDPFASNLTFEAGRK